MLNIAFAADSLPLKLKSPFYCYLSQAFCAFVIMDISYLLQMSLNHRYLLYAKGFLAAPKGWVPPTNQRFLKLLKSCDTRNISDDITVVRFSDILNIVRHERTLYKVCVTAQKMRVGPSEPACRSRLQTTSSCCGQKPW